jgi:hypothetical protein
VVFSRTITNSASNLTISRTSRCTGSCSGGDDSLLFKIQKHNQLSSEKVIMDYDKWLKMILDTLSNIYVLQTNPRIKKNFIFLHSWVVIVVEIFSC